VEDAKAVFPRGVGVLKKWNKASSLQLVLLFWGTFSDLSKRGQDVVVVGHVVDIRSRFQHARPSPKTRHPCSTFVNASLFSLVISVVIGSRGTVVCHENQQCVILDAPVCQLLGQASHVVIDILDHPVETDSAAAHARVNELLFVGIRRNEWAVWCVGGDVGKERLFTFLRAHPFHRLVKENVRAESFGLFEGIVVQNGWIKIFVAGCVSATACIGLADSASAMDKHFIETTLVGPVWILVSQVPLTKNARRVSGIAKHLGHRWDPEFHAFTFKNGVCHTHVKWSAARHDG